MIPSTLSARSTVPGIVRRPRPWAMSLDDGRARIGLASIVAVALSIRLTGLVHGHFYCDEASTALFSGLRLGELFSAIRDIDANPPGFYFIAWAMAHAFGDAPWVSEIPSILFGTATIVVVFAIGRTLGKSNVAGLVAATLAAVHPTAVMESFDARAYALVGLGAACLSFLLVRGAATGHRLWSIVGIALATSVTIYAHYTGIIFCGVAVFFAALESRFQREVLLRLGIASALSTLLYLPWVPSLLVHARVGYPTLAIHVGVDDWFFALLAAVRFPMLPGPAGTLGFGQCLALCAIYLAYVASRSKRDPAFDRRLLCWSGCVAACIGIFVLRGVESSRYAITTFPLAWAILGVVFARALALAKERDMRPHAMRRAVAFGILLAVGAIDSLWVDGRNVLALKSGIVVFAGALPSRETGVVVSAPDYYAPTLWYALGRRRGIRLDSFVRHVRPEWYRFSQGYREIWADPHAVDEAAARIERESAHGRLWLIMDPQGNDRGKMLFSKAGLLLARLERTRIVTSDRIYPGSVETVRIVQLDPKR